MVGEHLVEENRHLHRKAVLCNRSMSMIFSEYLKAGNLLTVQFGMVLVIVAVVAAIFVLVFRCFGRPMSRVDMAKKTSVTETCLSACGAGKTMSARVGWGHID